jgi:hypothetical protein
MLRGYTYWEEFCDLINSNCDFKYSTKLHHVNDHYGLSCNEQLPYSITEYEFNFIKDFILKNGLKSGFELGTGIAVSSIAIGYALRENGGKLLSVDSYAEQENQIQPIGSSYRAVSNDTFLNNNKELLNLFNISDSVFLIKGLSPNDIPSLISKYLSEKIDFIFFDCPKDYDDYLRDIEPVLPFLNKDRFAIFVHDTHCYMDQFKEDSIKRFGIDSIQIYQFDCNGVTESQKYPLSLITNIDI